MLLGEDVYELAAVVSCRSNEKLPKSHGGFGSSDCQLVERGQLFFSGIPPPATDGQFRSFCGLGETAQSW